MRATLARLRGGQGRHPDRHPPAALARRPRRRPGAADRRRGAALRGPPEGAPAPAEAQGGRALDVGDADPSHPADEPGGRARHLGDRDAPRGAPADSHLRRPLRRGAGAAGRSSASPTRGGQAFFLHNRIETLHEVAERLRALCPGVRFAEAHGQMDEAELERTMLEFLRGEADCLVATTIIESGLDIPQANTLIVERADELGLAQAYQIRGPRGAVARARLRLPALSLGRGAQLRGRGPPGHAVRPHRAGLRVRDRDARPRAARRRRPARRGAVGPRGGGRLRALRLAARRRGRRSFAPPTAPARPRPRCGSTSTSTPTCPPTTSPSRRRRSTSTGGWRAPASRASCAPCATSSATASARCPSRSRACSSSSARGSSWAASAPGRSSSAASGCR